MEGKSEDVFDEIGSSVSKKGIFRIYNVKGVIFTVPEGYELQYKIADGSHGSICSGVQQIGAKGPRKVAIKKIDLSKNSKNSLVRIYREMKIMRMLNHENILRLYDHFAEEEKKHCLYEVFELMDTDLSAIIGSKQKLSEDHIKFFLYQISRGLKYIHSAGLVHGNLRSSQILVNADCDLKINGFKFCLPQNVEVPSEDGYVATRQNKSPEHLCNYKYAIQASDIWSVGCILGELITRRAFFHGRNYIHQIHLIMDFTGKPTPEEIWGVEKAKQFISTIEAPNINRFLEALKQHSPHISDDGWDLLSKMLVFDPSKRITVEQVLNHRFLEDMQDPDEVFPVYEEKTSHDFQFIEEGMFREFDEVRKYILYDNFLHNQRKLIWGWDRDLRERLDYLREEMENLKEEEEKSDNNWRFDEVFLKLVEYESL